MGGQIKAGNPTVLQCTGCTATTNQNKGPVLRFFVHYSCCCEVETFGSAFVHSVVQMALKRFHAPNVRAFYPVLGTCRVRIVL